MDERKYDARDTEDLARGLVGLVLLVAVPVVVLAVLHWSLVELGWWPW